MPFTMHDTLEELDCSALLVTWAHVIDEHFFTTAVNTTALAMQNPTRSLDRESPFLTYITSLPTLLLKSFTRNCPIPKRRDLRSLGLDVEPLVLLTLAVTAAAPSALSVSCCASCLRPRLYGVPRPPSLQAMWQNGCHETHLSFLPM